MELLTSDVQVIVQQSAGTCILVGRLLFIYEALLSTVGSLKLLFLPIFSVKQYYKMTTNGVNGVANGYNLPALAESAEDFLAHSYDYLIVGGGTAGLVSLAQFW